MKLILSKRESNQLHIQKNTKILTVKEGNSFVVHKCHIIVHHPIIMHVVTILQKTTKIVFLILVPASVYSQREAVAHRSTILPMMEIVCVHAAARKLTTSNLKKV